MIYKILLLNSHTYNGSKRVVDNFIECLEFRNSDTIFFNRFHLLLIINLGIDDSSLFFIIVKANILSGSGKTLFSEIKLTQNVRKLSSYELFCLLNLFIGNKIFVRRRVIWENDSIYWIVDSVRVYEGKHLFFD